MTAILATLVPILIPSLGTLITALLGLALDAIKKKQQADTAATKAQTASLKLAEIVTMLATKAWAKLSPKVQAALANDGKIDAAERAEIEKVVAELVTEFTSADSLTEISTALGLPLPGIIARIAAGIIDMVTKAHDPDITNSMAPAAFPVGARVVVTAQLDPNDPVYQGG